MKGTVTKMEWVNPHVWLHMDVKTPDGKAENWAFEAGTPNVLFRRGFTRKSLLPGTVILIDGYQAKDGSRRANGRNITFEDGKKLFMGSSGTGAPYELNQKTPGSLKIYRKPGFSPGRFAEYRPQSAGQPCSQALALSADGARSAIGPLLPRSRMRIVGERGAPARTSAFRSPVARRSGTRARSRACSLSRMSCRRVRRSHRRLATGCSDHASSRHGLVTRPSGSRVAEDRLHIREIRARTRPALLARSFPEREPLTRVVVAHASAALITANTRAQTDMVCQVTLARDERSAKPCRIERLEPRRARRPIQQLDQRFRSGTCKELVVERRHARRADQLIERTRSTRKARQT